MINVREATAKHLQEDFNISPEVTERLFNEGLLTFKPCRDVLLKREYLKKAQPKEKQRIKERIANAYCVSVDLVRKIVE
jgi:hypothetical protein